MSFSWAILVNSDSFSISTTNPKNSENSSSVQNFSILNWSPFSARRAIFVAVMSMPPSWIYDALLAMSFRLSIKSTILIISGRLTGSIWSPSCPCSAANSVAERLECLLPTMYSEPDFVCRTFLRALSELLITPKPLMMQDGATDFALPLL